MGFTDNSNMYMPVAPANYGNGGFGNFGGDGAWWLLVLLFAMGGWGNGFGVNGGAPLYAMNTNNDVQRGFDQSAVMGSLNTLNASVTGGFADTAQAICSSTAGITGAINSGFASAEIANNSRQMSNMQQQFGLQSQLAQCCCDNRLATADLKATVLSENCEDRNALNQAIQSLLVNNNANTQKILDVMCQNTINAKDETISNLRQQLLVAELKGTTVAASSGT